MSSSVWTKLTASALGLGLSAVLANGCSGEDKSSTVYVTPDASIPSRCAAGAKICVDARSAATCSADGTRWLLQSCDAGAKCDGGECKADPAATCPAGAATCLNATTALRCRADRAGYESIACPTGTTCTGDGVCRGACDVGSTKCLSTAVLATCADGKTFTPTACGAGELCVNVTTTAPAGAACKPAACTPAANGCAWVCGDKTNPAADPTRFRSRCVEAGSGYQWEVDSCVAPATCNPTGASCSGGSQAACAAECTPGRTRCSGDKLGIQTCDANGKWGAALQACNPTTGTGLQCMTKPGDPTQVVCGDPLCASGAAGTCEVGGLRACGSDGRVEAAATPCTAGICVASGNPVGGLRPGACQSECLAGDERCVASGVSNAYQTCTAAGRWSNPQACPAAADGGASLCRQYTTSLGRPARVCAAECTPGDARCVGVDAGAGDGAIQTCSAAGRWDAPTACAVGRCVSTGGVGARCVADCIPNAPVCMGNAKTVSGLTVQGTDAYGTCSPQGLLPTSTTACTGTTVCRRNAGGQAIAVGGNACLECVGGSLGNEAGLTDRRCANAAGDAGGSAATQVCGADNTWANGALTACPVPDSGPACVNGICINGSPTPCMTGVDPVDATATWTVCSADANSVWIAGTKPGGARYHAEYICKSLGYTGLGSIGGTCGTVCGYCGAGSCSANGNATFDGGGSSCGTDALGQILCFTVHWKCVR